MGHILEFFRATIYSILRKINIKTVVVCIGLIIFLTGVIDLIRDNRLLNDTGVNFCATVNSITEAKRGVDVHYSYIIKGVEFRFSSNVYTLDKVCVGCSYFLVYSSRDPEVHEIDFSKKISKCN
ncbi:MAG TPA: hypothetical protein PLW44_06440 [Chitinophagales bacterium]|nr:hypothetical protein [Chitinophagales bacterium]